MPLKRSLALVVLTTTIGVMVIVLASAASSRTSQPAPGPMKPTSHHAPTHDRPGLAAGHRVDFYLT